MSHPRPIEQARPRGVAMVASVAQPRISLNGSTRVLIVRVGAYMSAAILILSLIGLAAQPSTGTTIIALWSLEVISAAILLIVVLTTQANPQKLERLYEERVKEAADRFARLSTRDWLTGMLSKTEFRDALRIEISRWKRHGSAVSITTIEPAPEVLARIQQRESGAPTLARFMADSLSKELRETDTLGRAEAGGAVWALLPQTDTDGAVIAAARIRARFDRSMLTLPDGDQVAVPMRVETATCPDDGAGVEELMGDALDLAA